jgi:predicted DNA-binding protein with PD1-like motif
MQTLIIDVINNKALRLLQDMELLQLIHVRREKQQIAIDWVAKYKGAMTKQPLAEVENQLNELRNEWE